VECEAYSTGLLHRALAREVRSYFTGLLLNYDPSSPIFG
jgi:hypothetical protein